MSPVQMHPKRKSAAKAARNKRLQERLQRQLALVASMPDEAAIDVQLVSVLRGRSVASTWRDVKAGLLAPPFSAGPRSRRWRLGDVRGAR
jgi:hypothetical protein